MRNLKSCTVPVRLRFLLSLLLFALAAGSGRAMADADPLENLVSAELVAEHDGVSPGGTAMLGLRLHHAPHWHTYWVVPGDAGLATQLKWKLEPGYRAGPIEWPAPRRLIVGNLANYGYEGDVLLPVPVRIPDSMRVGSTARFAAHAQWLVCNDLCIPGEADLALQLPVRGAADVRAATDAKAFSLARRRTPADLHLAGAGARLDGSRVRLEFDAAAPPRRLEFFPLESGRIVAAADQTLALRGHRVSLTLQAATPVEAGFSALRGVLVADDGADNGWVARIELPMSAAPVAGRAADAPVPAAAAAQAVRPEQEAASGLGAGAAAQSLPRSARSASMPTLLLALAGAFLGGLVLNLMPCVFPVLSLKLMALVKHRGDESARLPAHGAAYSLGVVLSFVGLAGLLIALRAAGSSIGWGFQLQSPVVIALLICLFFLIGLNLLGAFEFTFGSGLANSGAAQSLDGEGLRGSFATGVLAAVVASPCTAPFMGAALGFALTQSALAALAVFAALGAGMAAPYLFLTLMPSWLEHLPRPGAWMERLRQFMAFPMFLTCVWLFWVLGQQIGVDAIAWMLAALVCLGLFAWSAGLAQRGSRSFRWLAAVSAVLAAFVAWPLAQSMHETRPALAAAPGRAADWVDWSPAGQREALGHGQPVFVDFTAAWCITCQANKRLVLHDERVEAAFALHGVVRMQADWTLRDESITRELERFSRSGVPMYVLYDRLGVAHLLPEILSTQGLLEQLAAI